MSQTIGKLGLCVQGIICTPRIKLFSTRKKEQLGLPVRSGHTNHLLREQEAGCLHEARDLQGTRERPHIETLRLKIRPGNALLGPTLPLPYHT